MPSSSDGNIEVRYLGRVLSVYPAEVCKPFEKYCTVMAREREPASADNNWTVQYYTKPENAFWYDSSGGRRYFCAFSGFGSYIIDCLSAKYPGRVEVRDCRDSGLGKPDMDFLRHVSWRPGQKQVVASMLAYRSGQILCDVGFGKSFIAGKLARAFPKSKIVITVPIKQVALDIYNSLRTDLADVGMVGGGRRRDGRVMVAVTHSLKHTDPDANLVIVDEAHKAVTPAFIKMLFRFGRAKMFGMTASEKGRSDNRDRYLEAVFGPVLCDVSYQENVELGNVVPLGVAVYPVTAGPSDLRSIKDDTQRKRTAIWRNEYRNQVIAQAVKQQLDEMGDDTQILIMVESTEHARMLGKLLPEFVVVHNTIDPKLRRRLEREGVIEEGAELCTDKQVAVYKEEFAARRITRAISTNVWSTGVNFWDLKVLVRAAGDASEINSTQIPGRLSRHGATVEKHNGRIVDFSDGWDTLATSRWSRRKAVYKEKGWEIHYRDL